MIELTNDENAVIEYNKRLAQCKAEYPDIFEEISPVTDFKDIFTPWNEFQESLTEDDFAEYKIVKESKNHDFTGFYIAGINDQYLIEQLTEYKEDRKSCFMMPYGVCDNASQVMGQYDLTGSVIVIMSPVFRKNQPEDGGWRWHRWGRYIGEKKPEYEYLYDEKDIELVFVFSIIKLIKKTRKEHVNEMIPYGTKIIYHGPAGWENCKCYCGHYNKEDDTYNIYKGWDLAHVNKDKIEIKEW